MDATTFFGRHIIKFKVLSDYTTKSMTDHSLASKAWPIFSFIFSFFFDFTQEKKIRQIFFVATGENFKNAAQPLPQT
jgi:hypothetical protein